MHKPKSTITFYENCSTEKKKEKEKRKQKFLLINLYIDDFICMHCECLPLYIHYYFSL